MGFVVTKRVLLCLILGIHLFIRPSFEVQRSTDLPVIDLKSFRYQYFSLKKTRRYPYGIIQTVQVYDEFACLQYCGQKKGSCISVNFEKQAENGLHLCEILTSDSHSVRPDDGFKDDVEFDNMSPVIYIYPSCAEVPWKISGVYHIRPFPSHSILPVFCDMTTSDGGWTVIQKRVDGSVDFYRNWDDYKQGFGDKSGEYWFGLENIHTMTSQRSYRLRFDLEDFEGNTRYAEYSSFLVSGETDNYRVTVGTYSGTAGDSFVSFHNGMQFTTKDRDNDNNPLLNCAVRYTGAWWYSGCHYSNLNGQYLHGPGTLFGKGINWLSWLGYNYSLKRVEIKIRPV